MTSVKIKQTKSRNSIYKNPLNKGGMPDLVSGSKPLSYFEFWPTWLFYFPMKLYAGLLALRYGGLTLPTITNPYFDVGGFVGESKSQILEQVPAAMERYFCTHTTIKKSGDDEVSLERDLGQAKDALTEKNIQYPCVAKPDVGERGVGVQCVYNDDDLKNYISSYPANETIILQELADYPFEAGLFYIRKPDEKKGRIFSLTLKYFPYVTGDGKSTLRELIETDKRAGKISHIYLPRHRERLEEVIPAKSQYRIAFAGSHSRGTIFKNGASFITEDMTEKWDRFCQDIPEFYFGRFDVRFHKLEDLQTMKNIKIIEINGSGAEATHIWDSGTKLHNAYGTLMKQYKAMFEIGAMNRKRGFQPLPLKELIGHIKNNERLTENYPLTH